MSPRGNLSCAHYRDPGISRFRSLATITGRHNRQHLQGFPDRLPTPMDSSTPTTGDHAPVRPTAPLLLLAPPRRAAILFSLVTLAMFTAAYLLFDAQRRDIKAHSERNLANIAALKSGQIGLWLKERRDDAAIFSDRTPIAYLFDAWLRHGMQDDAERRWLLARMNTILGSRTYEAMALLDRQGQMRLTTGVAKDTDARVRQLVLDAMRARQIRFGEIHADPTHGPCMDLAAPLLVGSGNDILVAGALYFHIDPSRFLYPLIESWPIESHSAETLIVRQDGDQVLFMNRLRHHRDPPLSLRLPLASPELPAAQVLSGKTGFTSGRDYRGEKVVAYLARIPDTDWGMVAKIDEAEIYAPIHRLAFYTVMGLALLLCFVAYVFWSMRARALQAHLQQQAELRHRLMAQRFDYLARFSNDIIFLGDEQGRLIEVNDRAVQAYGYTRAQMLRMAIGDLRTPTARQAFEHDMRRLETYGQARFETEHRRQDGSHFPVEISARLINFDGRQHMQAIIRDISERRRAEAALRLHELMTRHMQEGLSLVRSADGVIVFANPKFAAMFGYESGELHGQHISCINASTRESPYEIASRIMAALEHHGTWSGEIRNIRKNGTQFWCSATVSGFDHAEHGQVWLSIHQDISERKQLEQVQTEYLARIRHLGQRLLAVQEDERRRLGAELHDRTTANLASIKLLLQGLAAKLPRRKDRALAHEMEDIQALMEDTSDVIRQISTDLHPPLLDFLGLDTALTSLAGSYSRRLGIPVRLRSSGMPRLDATVETAFYRIVQEALDNCARFAYAAKIDVDLSCIGDRVLLTIADDGIGFMPEAAEVGSGQGIPTMRERVEFAGGKFRIDASAGRGTRIHVELPCPCAAAAGARTALQDCA